MLQELAKLLQLLETATVFLSKEANVIRLLCLPRLITNLEATDEDLPVIRHFKVIVVAALRRCRSFDSNDLMSSPAFLSALDPRFKALKFLSDPEKESMKAHLVQPASEQDLDEAEEEKNECVPPATKKKKIALNLLLDPEEAQCEEEQGAAVEEVTWYFAEKPVARDTKPLVFFFNVSNVNNYRVARSQ